MTASREVIPAGVKRSDLQGWIEFTSSGDKRQETAVGCCVLVASLVGLACKLLGWPRVQIGRAAGCATREGAACLPTDMGVRRRPGRWMKRFAITVCVTVVFSAAAASFIARREPGSLPRVDDGRVASRSSGQIATLLALSLCGRRPLADANRRPYFKNQLND